MNKEEKTMNEKKNMELNAIYRKINELYHAYYSHDYFSISESWILYYIYESKGSLTQSDISKIVFLSKQTVNSSVSRLVNKGYITLEHIDFTRNSKSVKLTKKGENICKRVIKPLLDAEESALSKMTKREVEDLIELLNKQYEFLKEEIEKICKTKKGNKK